MLNYSNLTALGREEEPDKLPQGCSCSQHSHSCQQFLREVSVQLMCNHKTKIQLTPQHQDCKFRSPLGRKMRIFLLLVLKAPHHLSLGTFWCQRCSVSSRAHSLLRSGL